MRHRTLLDTSCRSTADGRHASRSNPPRSFSGAAGSTAHKSTKSRFFFASALVTIDRAQGVIGALLTTPERVSRYLWVRALALSALGTGETAFIVFVAIGPDHEWRWFVAGAGLLSFIYALVGMAIVATYAEFRSFLRASPTWVFAFSLPLLGSVHLLPGWLFLWHPVKPALILIEGSARAVSSSAVVYGILAGIVSCSVAFRLAKSRLLALGPPEGI